MLWTDLDETWIMMKVGVLSGVVYGTYHQGVWGSGAESEAILHHFGATVRPVAQRYLGSYWEQAPSPSSSRETVREYWNWGVHGSIMALSNAPRRTTELLNYGYTSVLGLFK
uniref:MICOS complex subunit MIC13 isoform X2 n=1 Tax=Myxine glutinosa TaxID=7769 RepID=UPI00358EAF1D